MGKLSNHNSDNNCHQHHNKMVYNFLSVHKEYTSEQSILKYKDYQRLQRLHSIHMIHKNNRLILYHRNKSEQIYNIFWYHHIRQNSFLFRNYIRFH